MLFVLSKINYIIISQYNEFSQGIIQKSNTLLMNSKNSKTSDCHRLLFYLTDETDLRKKDKYLLYQALTFTINGKI